MGKKIAADYEAKPTFKRSKRRASAWKDKARRGKKRGVPHREFIVQTTARRLARCPVVSQSLFELMVEELIERSVYPDERAPTAGAVNVRTAMSDGVIVLDNGSLTTK